jgi:primosomal protein N' (replication factor Y)
MDEAQEGHVAAVVFTEGPTDIFHYSIPDDQLDKVAVGKRLRVPLGRGGRVNTGYCVAVETRASLGRIKYKLRDIRGVLDAAPIVSSEMLRLAEWMAEYYLSPLGPTLESIVPAGVRGQAGTRQVTLLTVPNRVAARLTQLKLPPKQRAALEHLVASAEPLTAQQVAKAIGSTTAPVNALREKGLVDEQLARVATGDPDESSVARTEALPLNDAQQAALTTIVESLEAQRHEAILLHGVTGSGKTEVYMRAIEEVIQYGRQAIVLVPEISLTPQTCERFRSRFQRVAVLHSHQSDSERHWYWRRIAAGQVQVVIGARSAVFAPTPQLGIIVVDEEHDSSFKQDMPPRYHAREVALYRTHLANAPLVLGSATPSLESYFLAKKGRRRLVELPDRVLNLPLPDVTAIDLRTEFRSEYYRGAISRPLEQAMRLALGEQGKVILLLNRRGFSTHIQCPACGHVAKCPDCDIALTHHREGDCAVCHYCEHERPAPASCPECRFDGIRYGGLGTQKLEAEVRGRFPEANCLRMDSDTMQKAGSHEAAFARFRNGDVKILLGTQMIAKGLDFPDVTLVGVINADTSLHFPDFRAAERTFQLVTQVAGRTGRGTKGGRVLVQTFSPEHAALQAAMQHDYVTFAEGEIPIRGQFGYPPTGSMVRLIIRGESERLTLQFAQRLAEEVRSGFPANCAVRVLGPAPAPIARLRGKHRFHILLSALDRRVLRSGVKAAREAIGQPPDDVQWVVDVDPLDML